MTIIPVTKRKVPRDQPLFPDRPSLSPEEIAKRESASKIFADRCRVVFHQVAPELIAEHYDWFILIEPDSGDYFIAPDHKTAYDRARQSHPQAKLMAMRLNETGTCGRI
jgi:hypothetical protein